MEKYRADDDLDQLSFAWAGGDRARPAPLLPGPGSAPAGRVRQHPTRRQPRPHGMARSRIRFRWRRPRPALRRATTTTAVDTASDRDRCGSAAGGAVEPRTTSSTGSRIRLASIWPSSIRAARRPLAAWFWRTVVSGGTDPLATGVSSNPTTDSWSGIVTPSVVGDAYHPGGDVVGHGEDGRRRRIASQQLADELRELDPIRDHRPARPSCHSRRASRGPR